LIVPNCANAGSPAALTWNPVPGVLSTTPLGEFTLKKFAGRGLGDDSASGTPSQLISRRPLSNDPTALGLSGPRPLRNASTVGLISAAVGPALEKTT
jgi:hypothetical protein